MKLNQNQLEHVKTCFFELLQANPSDRIDTFWKTTVERVGYKRAITVMASKFALTKHARDLLETMKNEGISYQHFLTGFKYCVKQWFFI